MLDSGLLALVRHPPVEGVSHRKIILSSVLSHAPYASFYDVKKENVQAIFVPNATKSLLHLSV